MQSRDCKAALAALEAHLDRHDFAVERYSVADIALFGYTPLAADAGFDLAKFPAVQRWSERLAPAEVRADER